MIVMRHLTYTHPNLTPLAKHFGGEGDISASSRRDLRATSEEIVVLMNRGTFHGHDQLAQMLA